MSGQVDVFAYLRVGQFCIHTPSMAIYLKSVLLKVPYKFVYEKY